MFLELCRRQLGAARVFAQKGNPAEFGPHFVVQILGDAGAFPFEGALLFEAREAALKLSFFEA